jgi:hypothetical protein
VPVDATRYVQRLLPRGCASFVKPRAGASRRVRRATKFEAHSTRDAAISISGSSVFLLKLKCELVFRFSAEKAPLLMTVKKQPVRIGFIRADFETLITGYDPPYVGF